MGFKSNIAILLLLLRLGFVISCFSSPILSPSYMEVQIDTSWNNGTYSKTAMICVKCWSDTHAKDREGCYSWGSGVHKLLWNFKREPRTKFWCEAWWGGSGQILKFSVFGGDVPSKSSTWKVDHTGKVRVMEDGTPKKDFSGAWKGEKPAVIRRGERHEGSPVPSSPFRGLSKDILQYFLSTTPANPSQLIQGFLKEVRIDTGFFSSGPLAATYKAARKQYNRESSYRYQTGDKYHHTAVIMYTRNELYGIFNRDIRSLNSVDEATGYRWRHYFRLLYNAISNLNGSPPILPSGTLLYRGERRRAQELREGGTIEFPQFTSLTLSRDIAQHFAGSSGSTLYTIQGIPQERTTSCPYLGTGNHNNYPEEEILLSSGVPFTIVKIEEDSLYLRLEVTLRYQPE